MKEVFLILVEQVRRVADVIEKMISAFKALERRVAALEAASGEARHSLAITAKAKGGAR